MLLPEGETAIPSGHIYLLYPEFDEVRERL